MTPPALPASGRRLHVGAAIRSLSPSGVIVVTLALVVGGSGLASAATGGDFLLGRANHEAATASLSNSRGTPLALAAPRGRAPLAVNQGTMVKNLNAQYTGGLTAAQLQPTGGVGFTPIATDTPIGTTSVVVVATERLPAGTYYVTATALLEVAPGDGFGFCWVAKASTGAAVSLGGQNREGWVQAAETAAVAITAGDFLEEGCYVGASNGSVLYNAGITAARVLASYGTSPARAGRPMNAAWPGRGDSRVRSQPGKAPV
jgi:hypothetical protein